MNEVAATVLVATDPARAFTLFTEDVDRWWRRGDRYGGPEGTGHRFEGEVGGRFLQLCGESEHALGLITVWMRPNPGQDVATADSMQRFAAAARAQPGCIVCATFRNEESGELYGLGVWESEQASADGSAACMSAVAEDDFDVLVADMENHRLIEL